LIKKLIVATILIALLCAMVDAKMPQKGDRVDILTTGTEGTRYQGTITDIDNGFICLDCTSAYGQVEIGKPAMNVCIGIGTISALLWTEDIENIKLARGK
jgi:hypothetical protein